MADILNQEIALRQQQLADISEMFEFLIRRDPSSEMFESLFRDMDQIGEEIDLLSEENALLQGGRAIPA